MKKDSENTTTEFMSIYDLQEYAKEHGYNSGRFVCVCEKGVFELQWLDAYYGFIKFLQPEVGGMIMTKQMIEIFGRDQKYLPTIGYDNGGDNSEQG